MTTEAEEPELIIGLVGRIGVDVGSVVEQLTKLLRDYGYDTEHIHVTDAIKQIDTYKSLPSKPLDMRFNKFIDACDEVREKTQLPDVMARFAISRIQDLRDKGPRKGSSHRGRAFIINQLKRKEECAQLRSIYGEHYLQISCYSPESARVARLSGLIAKGYPKEPKAGAHKAKAFDLLKRDETEEDNPNGQRVRDVFPLSDVVIDSSTPELAKTHLQRFLRAAFGDYRVSPTQEEYGMQLAITAALRSSDLSRQVGAAVLTTNAEVRALGCNEVPRAGGGTYWEGDEVDDRDFVRGRDSNDYRKREVLLELALRMQDAGLIDPKYKDNLAEALIERDDDIIRDAHMMDSLEYGRTVHAEMNAITDAARLGHPLKDCVLYCNTFPCHNCAKHIVASGVQEVIYLLPYPKSFAEDLFFDSISIDLGEPAPGKVAFRQFMGIVGPLYERVFAKPRWKNRQGDVPPFVERSAKLRLTTPLPIAAYEAKETEVIANLAHALDLSGLIPLPPAGHTSGSA